MRDKKGNAIVCRYLRENGISVDSGAAHQANGENTEDVRRTAKVYIKRVLHAYSTSLLGREGERSLFIMTMN